MGIIIFDLVLMLLDFWVMFNKDTPKLLKPLVLLAIILLATSVTMRVLGMIGIM